MGFGVIFGALAHLAAYAIGLFIVLACLALMGANAWNTLQNEYPKESDDPLISIGHKFWQLWLWSLVVVSVAGILISFWVTFWEFLFCFDSDNDCGLLGGDESAFGRSSFYKLIPRWLE